MKRIFEIRHIIRSGGHAVIQWLYGHYDNYTFKNNGHPSLNDESNIFYSLENAVPVEKKIKDNITRLLVIRDPLNYAASATLIGSAFNKNLYKKYLNSSVYTINYNLWFSDEKYRRQIEIDLCLPLGNDDNLNKMTHHGGGSSFSKLEFNGKAQEMDVLNRWRQFKDTPWIQDILNDEELCNACIEKFKMDIQKDNIEKVNRIMKYLILGDGQLGTELHKQTGWDYISRKKDFINFKYPQTYFDYLKKYDVIINCIAHTNTVHNEKQPHWDINYVGVIDLADTCKRLNKKLVHISSDYIYANSNPQASEEDVPVHLENWYTYTKLLADGYMQTMDDYLVIRTTFRPRPYPYPKAWLDHLTNADYTDVIVRLMIQLIEKDVKGVFNVGTEIKTLLSLAKKTVPHCEPLMDNHSYIRPQDVTMNIEKLENVLK